MRWTFFRFFAELSLDFREGRPGRAWTSWPRDLIGVNHLGGHGLAEENPAVVDFAPCPRHPAPVRPQVFHGTLIPLRHE